MHRTFFRRTAIAAGLCAALCAAPSAHADTNLLVNGGFDDLTGVNLTAGSFCYLNNASLECRTIPGWTSTDSPTLILADSSPWQKPAEIAGYSDTQGEVLLGLQSGTSIQQALTLAAGSYTLSWLDSHRNLIQFDTGAQVYEVRLGTELLASLTTAPGDPWQAHQVTFTTGGGTLALTFDGVQLLGPGGDATTFIDSVSLTSAVPEPGTWALMLGGLAGVAALRRRLPRG